MGIRHISNNSPQFFFRLSQTTTFRLWPDLHPLLFEIYVLMATGLDLISSNAWVNPYWKSIREQTCHECWNYFGKQLPHHSILPLLLVQFSASSSASNKNKLPLTVDGRVNLEKRERQLGLIPFWTTQWLVKSQSVAIWLRKVNGFPWRPLAVFTFDRFGIWVMSQGGSRRMKMLEKRLDLKTRKHFFLFLTDSSDCKSSNKSENFLRAWSLLMQISFLVEVLSCRKKAWVNYRQ